MPSFSEYKQGLAERFRARQAANEARRQKALSDAQRIANHLAQHFGVSRVWIFGSILYAGRYTEHSDIDIGVEGLAPEVHFRCLAAVGRMTTISINLIPLEDASDSMKESVFTVGKVLYDRNA